jgi:hypothetical protein
MKELLFTRGLQRSVPLFGGMDAEFEKAKTRLNTLSTEPGNDVKLQIYGLFSVYTGFMFILGSVYTGFMFILGSVYTGFMFILGSVYTGFMFMLGSVYTGIMFTLGSVYTEDYRDLSHYLEVWMLNLRKLRQD